MIAARSSLVCPSGTSSRYMKTVTKGAWPFVVIIVMTWYCIIWTPWTISAFTLISATLFIVSSSAGILSSANSFFTSRRYLSRDIWTNGARWESVILCPPYCEEAIWAIDCVAILQAVEKLCGFSIMTSLMTVPFWSISSRFTRQQLCICWAK